MLQAVNRFVLGMRGESNKFSHLQVFVMPMNIGVGVMDDVMCDLPDVPVGPHQVKK